MNCEDAEEFSQALGQVIGGSWRIIATAKKLGVPSEPSLLSPRTTSAHQDQMRAEGGAAQSQFRALQPPISSDINHRQKDLTC